MTKLRTAPRKKGRVVDCTAEGVVADKDADIVLLSILVMFKSPLLNFAVTKYLSNNFVKSVM